jgi:hypothetical protein
MSRHLGGARQLGRRQDVAEAQRQLARRALRSTQLADVRSISASRGRPARLMDGRAGATGPRDAILEEHASLAGDRTLQRARRQHAHRKPRRTQYIGKPGPSGQADGQASRSCS